MPIRTVDFDLDGVTGPVGPPAPPQYYSGPFYADLIGCQACPLRAEAKQVVPGIGPADSDWFFLAQNPGEEEDADGRPLIGRAGKELDKWLEILGLDRTKVVLSNAVKCHTALNREPRPAETAFCRDRWLRKELDWLAQVSILVTLGNPATRAVLGKDAKTTGGLQIYWADVKLGDRPFTVYPLAHPAYILRSTMHRERMYNTVLPELKSHLAQNHPEAYARARR